MPSGLEDGVVPALSDDDSVCKETSLSLQLYHLKSTDIISRGRVWSSSSVAVRVCCVCMSGLQVG